MRDLTDTIERLRDAAAQLADAMRDLARTAREASDWLVHLVVAYTAPPTLPTDALQRAAHEPARIPEPLDTGMLRIIRELTR